MIVELTAPVLSNTCLIKGDQEHSSSLCYDKWLINMIRNVLNNQDNVHLQVHSKNFDKIDIWVLNCVEISYVVVPDYSSKFSWAALCGALNFSKQCCCCICEYSSFQISDSFDTSELLRI